MSRTDRGPVWASLFFNSFFFFLLLRYVKMTQLLPRLNSAKNRVSEVLKRTNTVLTSTQRLLQNRTWTQLNIEKYSLNPRWRLFNSGHDRCCLMDTFNKTPSAVGPGLLKMAERKSWEFFFSSERWVYRLSSNRTRSTYDAFKAIGYLGYLGIP